MTQQQKQTPTQTIKNWISEFVTKPNPVFGDLPPCPFAQKAIIENKVEFLELDGVASYPTLDLEEWSVIVVHEYTASALENRSKMNSQPLGVVQISMQSSVLDDSGEVPLILPVMIFLAVGTLGLVSTNSMEKVREEE